MAKIQPQVAIARQHTIGDVIRRTARRVPDKIALVDGDVTLSYTQLSSAVDTVAVALQKRGLAKGDRCAVLSHNSWQFAVTAFATARLGIVLVPINFMLNADEVAYILGHSEPKAFVVEAALVDVAEQALVTASLQLDVRSVITQSNGDPGSSLSSEMDWEPFDAWMQSTGGHFDAPLVSDDDPVRLMYTSGTESRPKGVLLTSRSLMWQYVSCVVDGGMESDDVELHALPLYHCAQMDCFLGPGLYLGATNIIESQPEAGRLLAQMERHRVTKFFAPPTVWIALLRHPNFDSTDLSSLRKGYYGASAMPVEILQEIGDRLPSVLLWNFYGQTEMSPLATILKPDEQRIYPGSAGRPSINVETAIIDDDGNQLPSGQIGEIVHRSPHATLGYYRDPVKTAAAFQHGWFHSGDLGVIDDNGILHVVDRKKDMIKSGGENVASREVEEVLYEIVGVTEVAVFGVPDPRWVEAVAAAVVIDRKCGLGEDEIKAYARKRLAGYKRPKHIVIVESLPKNPSGKILKRVLRDGFEHTALGGAEN